MFTSLNPLIPLQPAPNNDHQFPQGRQSPQSHARKSTIGQGHQPKLRLSCDACAAAKVKCSKERPKCEKCVSNQTICIYGPSLKHGKPDKKRRQQERQATPPRFEANNVSAHQRPFANTLCEHDFYGDLQKSFADLIQCTGSDAGVPTTQHGRSSSSNTLPESINSTSPLSPFDGTLLQDSSIPSRTDSPMMGSLNQSPSNHDKTNALLDSFDTSAAWLSNLDFSSLMNQDTASKPKRQKSSSISLPEASGNGSMSRITSHNEAHDCYSIANSTLASLQFRSESSSKKGSVQSLSAYSPSFFSDSSLPVQAYEDLFRINQEAVSNVSQLLDCPCAGDPHMAMLYASIIVKVLYWYQVAAGTRSPEPCAHGSAKSMETTTEFSNGSMPPFANAWSIGKTKPASYSHDETFVTREPFRIGTYTPDEEDQEPMRRMLLLSNLKKVGRLIDSLAKIGGRVDEGASHLYGTLGAWLKTELSRTIKKGANGMEAAVAP